MKVLLINICLRPYLKEKYFFPIGLGYVASSIKKAGHDLQILDLDLLRDLTWKEIEVLIANMSFEVVCLGSIVTGYSKIKRLCNIIKRWHKVPIIVGNSVASSIPEIILTKTKADIVVFEEGDVTIVKLLKAIETGKSLFFIEGIAYNSKGGKIIYTPPREMIPDLDSIPFIDYNLWDMEMYIERFKYTVSEPYPMPFEEIRAFPMIISRGCLFKCTFCYHMFLGKRFRFRSVKNIMEEIDLLVEKYNVNIIFFADDLSLFSKKQANELADEFLKRNLFWSCCCRAGLFDDNDLELLLKLKKSGLYSLGFALESANENILKSMDKRISLEDFENQCKVLHKAGINTVTSIVLGYPEETLESIQETFDFCKKCMIYPSTGYLLPQPKTKMYEVALQMGLIKNKEKYLLTMGDRQDFKLNFTKLNKEEVEKLVKKNLKEISDLLDLNISEEKLVKMGHIKEKNFRGIKDERKNS